MRIAADNERLVSYNDVFDILSNRYRTLQATGRSSDLAERIVREIHMKQIEGLLEELNNIETIKLIGFYTAPAKQAA